MDRVEIELPTALIPHVRAEDHPLPIRMEEGAEVPGVVVGELHQVRAIRIHHVDRQLRGSDEATPEQELVLLERRSLGATRAEDDLRAIRRVERTAVVARGVREPPDIAAVRCHGVDLEVPIPHRGEADAAPVRRHRRLRVVAGRGGEHLEPAPVRVRLVDLVAVVDRPHIAHRAVGDRRAHLARGVGRGEEDLVVIRVEPVGAGGATRPGRDQLEVPAIEIHGVDLVALVGRALRLEDELLPVGGEVGLRVLPPIGELPDVPEVLLLRMRLSCVGEGGRIGGGLRGGDGFGHRRRGGRVAVVIHAAGQEEQRESDRSARHEGVLSNGTPGR